MIRNIRGHRIRWSMLFAQGALAGVLAALVMLAVAMVTIPLFSDGTDAWTFTKVVSSFLLGNEAAQPFTGFEFAPVLVGLLMHFAIGAAAGAVYAGLVGMFDLEGWTPVAMMGLVFGAILFVWSATIFNLGVTNDSTESALPLAAMLWGNIAFGLTMGLMLATWAERADLDQTEAERVRAFEGDESPGSLPR